MNKVLFSRTELNKFLLLGEDGQYITDKINPCIRAIKRKNNLSIFCTIRISHKTTSVKLGEFPENKIDEVYAKFKIAKRISENGSNPNIILQSSNSSLSLESNDLIEGLSFNELYQIFFKKKETTIKYRKDFYNCLKKNLSHHFNKPIRDYNKKKLCETIENLVKEKKLGTAKNFLFKINTLLLFFLKNESLNQKNNIFIKEILSISPKIKESFLKKEINIKNQRFLQKIFKKIKRMDLKKLKKIDVYLNKING